MLKSIALVSLLLCPQWTIPLYRPPVSTGGGGGAHYVNNGYAAYNTGSYSANNVTFTCASASHFLIAVVGSDQGIGPLASSSITGAGSWTVIATATTASSFGTAGSYELAAYKSACPDTVSHTYNWAYSNGYVAGRNYFNIFEVAATSFDAGSTVVSAPSTATPSASATATMSGGMALSCLYTHGQTPNSVTSGYTQRDAAGAYFFCYTDDTAYASAGTVSFTANMTGPDVLPVEMVLFH